MKGEFYKMDFRAWNLGTVDLTLEQEAAYLRLCHAMYDARGPVPNTTRLLQGIFRCGNVKASALVRQLIESGKIEKDAAGRLLNHRVMDELAQRNRGGSPSPRASVASLTGECASSEGPVTSECGSSAGSVTPECGSSATPVTPAKALENNDLFPLEKSREEKKREEESRKEGENTSFETLELTPEELARVEAVFGPAALAEIEPLSGADLPDQVPDGPKAPSMEGARFEPKAYAYNVGKFRITHEDLAKLEFSFPHADVRAICQSASTFLVEKNPDNWWGALNGWLKKENQAGRERQLDRKVKVEVEVEKAGKPQRSRHQW